MALAVGTSFGPYHIVAPLGAGGMGEVYRARDERLRRDVAIKVLPESFTLDPERVARFEREAQIVASLSCPNIAAIYGIENLGALRGLVLELVDGPTLAERLAAGPLSTKEALEIARQLVDALDAAHERGVVHRDLKPANIKISTNDVVKVLDFGLAKAVDREASDSSVSPTITSDGTRAGAILGTAAYMSPEQARGKVVDKRTDIWAFGCVLFELLTGQRPFDGATVPDTIAAVLTREPDWTLLPSSTPPHVRRLLTRLLEKDSRRRLRDIADARPELENAAFVDGPTVSATAPAPNPWRAIALISLTVAAAATTLTVWSYRRAAVPASAMAARAVVSQLTNYGNAEASGAIAPDGRSFAFVSEHGGTPDIWLRQIAGGDPVRLTNDAAIESELIFAPDGESLYYTRQESGDRSVWKMLAFGGQARRVLGGASVPSPSPDGRSLAWAMQEPSGLYRYEVGAIDGSDKRTLVSGIPPAPVRPSWSADSRRIAYSSGGLFTPRNLHIVDVASGTPRQVTHFNGSSEGPFASLWLPDNRNLVVSFAATPGALRPRDLGILDSETGAIERISANLGHSFDEATLSANGSRLLVTSTLVEREVWKVPFGPDPTANGRAAVRVLDASVDPMWTFVSRDGRTLLFNNNVIGSRNLWTMPLDGSRPPHQITTVPDDAVMHSSLSPDGKQVAFASNTTGQSDIWVQNVDGSDLRRLTNDREADSWPAWTPDGSAIIYSGGDNLETRRVPATGGRAEKIGDGFFRGDLFPSTDGRGLLIATSNTGGGLRVLESATGNVLWQQRPLGNAMPTFSPDGTLISHPYRESRDRDAIWVYETKTGQSRVAVRFSEPFTMFFRASWTDDGRAFIVNRYRNITHIVMFDKFWQP